MELVVVNNQRSLSLASQNISRNSLRHRTLKRERQRESKSKIVFVKFVRTRRYTPSREWKSYEIYSGNQKKKKRNQKNGKRSCETSAL